MQLVHDSDPLTPRQQVVSFLFDVLNLVNKSVTLLSLPPYVQPLHCFYKAFFIQEHLNLTFTFSDIQTNNWIHKLSPPSVVD